MQDPRSRRGGRRSENRGGRKQGHKSSNRTLDTAERKGGTGKQIRSQPKRDCRPAKACWRSRPSSQPFAKSQHRIKASATDNFRTVSRNCTRTCRRSNSSSAATTQAPENCAKEGARGREHPRNHFVFFGESPCDLHASPQVSGEGTFGQRYGNWSLHSVGRSSERSRKRSFNGAKYRRLNLGYIRGQCVQKVAI